MQLLQQSRDFFRLPQGKCTIAGGDSYMHKKSFVSFFAGDQNWRTVMYFVPVWKQKVLQQFKNFYLHKEAIELRLIWGIISIL